MGASKFQVFIIIDSIKSKLTLFNSHLGQWEAVLVEGVPTLLNLTLYSSCGLIFGRLGSTRWMDHSFFQRLPTISFYLNTPVLVEI